MWDALSKLTKWDWIVVGAGLMLVAVLQVMPAPTDPDGAPQNTLTRNTQAALDKWRGTAKSYGAFATAPDGAWGWTDDYNTAPAAQANALAYCSRHGTGCRILETRDAPDGGALSQSSRAELARFRTSTGIGAFAASDNGASYWVATQPDRATAEAAALRGCTAQSKKGQPEFLLDWPCVVIETRGN